MTNIELTKTIADLEQSKSWYEDELPSEPIQ